MRIPVASYTCQQLVLSVFLNFSHLVNVDEYFILILILIYLTSICILWLFGYPSLKYLLFFFYWIVSSFCYWIVKVYLYSEYELCYTNWKYFKLCSFPFTLLTYFHEQKSYIEWSPISQIFYFMVRTLLCST